MSIRTVIAVLFAVAILAAGAIFTLQSKDASVADALAIVMRTDPNASLLCAIAGWGAAVAAVLGVLSALAAFLEEDEDDGYGRRGVPKIVPLVLILVSLVLFWTMFDCARLTAKPEPEVVSAPVVSPPPSPVEEPAAVTSEEPAPLAPELAISPSVYAWPYMIPLIRNGGYEDSAVLQNALTSVFPRSDPEGRIRDAFCGAAWVAIAGASSEEGPAERNRIRSRIRAELAISAARRWLDGHAEDCARPIILGLDLGQHSLTTTALGDGSDTAFQRSVIVISRIRSSADEVVSLSDAMGEAQEALDDPATLEKALAGRRYYGAPRLFVPDPNS